MSTWTEVTGIIRCDWVSWHSPKMEADAYTKDFTERRNLIQELFAEKNAPRGTEDSYIRGTILKGDINTIIILASLRDFGKEEIEQQVAPWWNNILEKLPFIRQAVMSCTTGSKTYIFEKRIASDFDLISKTSELWRPDPGIIVCTNREITKMNI